MSKLGEKRKANSQSHGESGSAMELPSAINKRPRTTSGGDKDSQRERKRATDRQAQRMARERTKQYIAHLEKTIEILRKENANETVSKLLNERNQLALEVQQYRKVLYGMRLAIDGAISGEPLAESDRQESVNSTDVSEEAIEVPRDDIPERSLTPCVDDSNFENLPWGSEGCASQGNEPLSNQDAIGLITLGLDPSNDSENDLLGSHQGLQQVKSNFYGSRQSAAATSLRFDIFPTQSLHDSASRLVPSIIFEPCGSLSKDRWWQSINQSYEMVLRAGAHGAQAVNMLTPSTVFKAIDRGWNEIAGHEQHNLVFKILREIDEKVFFQSDKTSRLALALKSHRALKFYLTGSRVTLSELASWQKPRPFQRGYKHPIAIDFFAWPGLRDKMVRDHMKYFETTDFSLAYRKYFKFNWPFSFEDTYLYDDQTDTYHISPLFENYHRNLNNWGFDVGFFRKFPELLEAIRSGEESQSADFVGELEAPMVTRLKNKSKAMMAVAREFPNTSTAASPGMGKTWGEAQSQCFLPNERGSGYNPLYGGRRNMGAAEQVCVEGLADLWMTA